MFILPTSITLEVRILTRRHASTLKCQQRLWPGLKGLEQSSEHGAYTSPCKQWKREGNKNSDELGVGARVLLGWVEIWAVSYLWYWACRKLNSSFTRSHDSDTVNLKGCPGWGGPWNQTHKNTITSLLSQTTSRIQKSPKSEQFSMIPGSIHFCDSALTHH